MTVEKIRPRTADEMAATIRKLVCECRDAYCPRRNEVDLLLTKAKEAEARIEQLTDDAAAKAHDHNLRSDALNRTGASNDQLRATLARVEKLADEWAGDPVGGDLWRSDAVDAIRAALADQEPASE